MIHARRPRKMGSSPDAARRPLHLPWRYGHPADRRHGLDRRVRGQQPAHAPQGRAHGRRLVVQPDEHRDDQRRERRLLALRLQSAARPDLGSAHVLPRLVRHHAGAVPRAAPRRPEDRGVAPRVGDPRHGGSGAGHSRPRSRSMSRRSRLVGRPAPRSRIGTNARSSRGRGGGVLGRRRRPPNRPTRWRSSASPRGCGRTLRSARAAHRRVAPAVRPSPVLR